MKKLLLRGMVLPMTAPDHFFADGEIAIQDDVIVSVGARKSAPAGFIPDEVIEYPNDVFMPGLINTHTHAAMTFLRGYADDLPLMQWLESKIWPYEDKMSDEDIYWGTLLALCEMIRSGTTTMLDMYMSMNQVAEAVLQAGTRAVLSRGLMDVGPNAELRLQENVDLLRQYQGAGEGRITVMFGPHAPFTCSGEYLRRIKKEADRHGVGLHIHVAETLDEIHIIKEQQGKTPVQWLEELGLFGGHVVAAHCVHLTDEDIAILKRNQVCVAHNPESNMKLNSGTARITELLKQGITVGLGTDGASSNNDLNLFGEMRTAAYQQKLVAGPTALPAYEVLEMATVGGAKTLALSRLGRLAPGYQADIISVNMEQPHFYPRHSIPAHLVYSALASDVRTVVVAGKVLMAERRLTTLEEKQICQEVERRAKGIAQSFTG
ncbi:MAG: amidohydrolase [Peptococcaceae bacterium]|jgi:5-methylthioadenosine/S-adenosylhomocysteine deaminase|nr:amidohydrolase [Peptococcaceae bacterium]